MTVDDRPRPQHERGKIKVCCRVRPVGKEANQLNIRQGGCVLLTGSSSAPSTGEGGGARDSRRGRERWGFTFDDVFEDGCTQEEVYKRCAMDIVHSSLSGVHGTIMACEYIGNYCLGIGWYTGTPIEREGGQTYRFLDTTMQRDDTNGLGIKDDFESMCVVPATAYYNILQWSNGHWEPHGRCVALSWFFSPACCPM